MYVMINDIFYYFNRACFHLIGTVVTQTQAQYPDGSQTGISYSIFSGNRMQSFGINSITGKWRDGSMHSEVMFSNSTV